MRFCRKKICGVVSAAVLGVSSLTASAVSTVAAEPVMSATATVRIAIRIGPIVEVSFPEGTNFSLEVVDAGRPRFGEAGGGRSRRALVAPATIPFEVRGNAHAVVSAMPGEVSRAFDAANPTGIARLPNEGAQTPGDSRMEYRTIVEFPDEDRGNVTTHGNTKRANVASGPMRGVVHVIPRSLRAVPSGRYSGAVQMAVYAEE